MWVKIKKISIFSHIFLRKIYCNNHLLPLSYITSMTFVFYHKFEDYKVLQTALKLVEKEITIAAPWGQIKGLTWGNPQNPPVLLVHGVADTCSSFRPLVSLLPTNYFYVGVDLPNNGRSDHLSKGVTLSMMDLLPTLWTVKEHFKWSKFRYVGHSLGCVLGKFFSIVYPNIITRTVELDPFPAYIVTSSPEDFVEWYEMYYGKYYDPVTYEKLNSNNTDELPKYTYEKAAEILSKSRGLTKEKADYVLERSLAPTPDGFYRFSFDPRMRPNRLPYIPMNVDLMQKLYTSIKTPIFTLFSKALVDRGIYRRTPFALDAKEWPHQNYRYKIIEGGHDFFLMTPEIIAEDVSKFLIEADSKL